MKKYLTTGSLIILYILIFISDCLSQDKIKISVDPRMELMGVIQYLSDYNERFKLLNNFEFSYKKDVNEYFSKFKEHPAVKTFEKLSNGFNFDAPPGFMLFLSDPPELEKKHKFTGYILSRVQGKANAEKFLKELRDFARESKFMDFFNSHMEIFRKSVLDSYKKLEGTDYAGALENFYGSKQSSYNIILSLLFNSSGYGPRIERENNTFDIYNITGPQGVMNDIPVFGSKENYRYLILHEFSHSFVNPLTEKYSKKFKAYESLFKPISKRMENMAYGDWLTCINEHVVRAITANFLLIENKREAYETMKAYEKKRGFVYIDFICEKLKEYNESREKYPAFKDFYPEIIELFKKLSKEKFPEDFYNQPFAGPINDLFQSNVPMVIIVPSAEENKDLQDSIINYVKVIKSRFFKDAEIMEDIKAIKQDLSKNRILAYGSVNGNLWIKEALRNIPIKVEMDRIVSDTIFSGTSLRLITALLNPQNSKLGAVIYTAQNAENVPGINSVFHGPTDYVITDSKKILRSGDYVKRKEGWRLK